MISVVIPTHNRKSTIKRAIDSVTSQTLKDIEIIVVSDGSTDGTNELVQGLSSTDNRIKLISYPHAKGGNYARNTGAKLAVSDYIAFLDDDDEWLPEKLEKQLSVFSTKQDVGLVYTGITVIYENDGYKYTTLPEHYGDLGKEILFHNCISTTSSVMLKKSVLEEVGFFDTNLSALQDYDLWIRCCQLTKVGCVEESLVNYYVNAAVGQITANTEKNHRAFEYIELKYHDLYQKRLNEEEKQLRLCNKFCGLAKYALKNGEGTQCRKYAAMAFKSKYIVKPILIYFSSLIGIKNVLRMCRLLSSVYAFMQSLKLKDKDYEFHD